MSRCRLHTRVEIRNFLLTFIDVDEPIFFIRNSIKMSELFRQKCKEYVSSNRKMKIKGTKYVDRATHSRLIIILFCTNIPFDWQVGISDSKIHRILGESV